MPKRINPAEKEWREEITALYPGRALLDVTEIGGLLGFAGTQTRAWLIDNGLPYTVTSSARATREHRKYRVADVARALAEATHDRG